ncbi:hypothetical protein HD554DRAFT_2059897 [Boletus coccyginus]|nr:hypothetical protein HD554DRAFT_2059897 [Boletus coccyginus]
MQAPVLMSNSCRRRRRRPSAINIDGLWIDKDDLSSGASQGSGIISVYECHWDKSSSPCGLWIVGSRSRVGAHIRKWHTQSYAGSMVKCLWEGCTSRKSMLKYSINRHVATVHIEEGFRCQGCNQEFSRKDMYDKHVQKSEVCRDAGAMMVYGTERRVIDTSQVLWRGGAVRDAD